MLPLLLLLLLLPPPFYKQKQLDPLAILGRTQPTKAVVIYSAIEQSSPANSRSSPAVKKG
jgi:hypothetical protein